MPDKWTIKIIGFALSVLLVTSVIVYYVIDFEEMVVETKKEITKAVDKTKKEIKVEVDQVKEEAKDKIDKLEEKFEKTKSRLEDDVKEKLKGLRF